MLVIYQNERETFVCESKDENYLLATWFSNQASRKLGDFSRDEVRVARILNVKPEIQGA